MKLFPIAYISALFLLSNIANAADTSVKCTATALNTEGKAITLAGVRIYYGKDPAALIKVVTAKSPDCSSPFTNLDAGTWYFSAKSFTADGTESAASNVVTRIIKAAPPVAPVLE